MSSEAFQIIFRAMDGSDAVRTEVRAWLTKLSALTDAAGMTGGHVLIDATYQQHHGAGWRYQATLQVSLTTGELVIGADCAGNSVSDDVYVAVRNVFRCLRRQLSEEQERTQRGHAAAAPDALATIGVVVAPGDLPPTKTEAT